MSLRSISVSDVVYLPCLIYFLMSRHLNQIWNNSPDRVYIIKSLMIVSGKSFHEKVQNFQRKNVQIYLSIFPEKKKFTLPVRNHEMNLNSNLAADVMVANFDEHLVDQTCFWLRLLSLKMLAYTRDDDESSWMESESNKFRNYDLLALTTLMRLALS